MGNPPDTHLPLVDQSELRLASTSALYDMAFRVWFQGVRGLEGKHYWDPILHYYFQHIITFLST